MVASVGTRRCVAFAVALALIVAPAYLWPGAGPGLTVAYTLYAALAALLAGIIALLDESRKPRKAKAKNSANAIPASADRDVREVGAMAFFCFFGFVSAILALIAGVAYGTPEQVRSVVDLLGTIGLSPPSSELTTPLPSRQQ